MPQAIMVINTTLGKDKDRLLVEQDSEGLRKLQDPSFTVPTISMRRIASVLSQMDGGSIALAGPRGAGKSTLLRRFSSPLADQTKKRPYICVYLQAPAEYVPRDFIAELFQRLCEAYLLYTKSPLPEPIYRERPRFNAGHMARRAISILWLLLRTAIAVAIIVWLTGPFIKTAYPHVHESIVATFSDWYNFASQHMRMWWKNYRVFCVMGLVILVVILIPGPARWKRYIRRRREPMLVKRAREYLHRLQVDKTVTWGTSFNSPAVRGVRFSMNRGGSASYAPWTLPELVGYLRRFMQDIAKEFEKSSHAVVVGIDEIDRIGSLDHAERFVGEIKATFGVEKCFFLVAVAEDVGSIFAQRATAGRSILENAFDDIVVVEPLSFRETRDLLIKRVPGFTDSFAYLAYALSGGLPRELIRVTRRLVEVNQESHTADLHPRLQDLAFALVKEELVEAIRATRNQVSLLTLHSNWAGFFETMRSASATLRHSSWLPMSMQESYGIIEVLSELEVPRPPKGLEAERAIVVSDEENARGIVGDFSAFSYFGLTVIDAFSDEFFDLQAVQHSTAYESGTMYEVLAVARTELSVSPASSRGLLSRFRNSLRSHEAE